MKSSRGQHHVSRPRTLVELLQDRAACYPREAAFTFWDDETRQETLSFSELDRRARAIAVLLQQRLPAREPVLLVYPAGLAFIEAFFGCLYAGCLAVPTTYPKPHRPPARLASIARDSGARVALTASSCLPSSKQLSRHPDLSTLEWIATDHSPPHTEARWQAPEVNADDLAFLQYTSGSTAEPRGVMISHGNLLHNLEVIRTGFGLQADSVRQTGVFWLPVYHDMGLIGGVLEPLYVGGHSVLLAPQSFLQRPFRWLEMMSRYGGRVSGAPNFAYELCAERVTEAQRRELDLSQWQVAFCGAEPICAETLERFADVFSSSGFRRDAFYPCYGLAEATLLAAGRDSPGPLLAAPFQRAALAQNEAVPADSESEEPVQRLVCCGRGRLGQDVRVVNPDTQRPVASGRVGEIWLRGPSVARGYWNRPDETEAAFRASLSGEHDGSYLRTGDLGFLYEDELYVTGRLKDVIIIRGRNYYPQDIEQTVAAAHPALAGGAAGCAFSIPSDGRERLVVVQEVQRGHRQADMRELVRVIRSAVAREHELEASAIVLVRYASLPRTTSGKIQRLLCRERYTADQLKTHFKWAPHEQVAAVPAPSNNHHERHPAGAIGGGAKAGERLGGETRSSLRNLRESARIGRGPEPLNALQRDQLAERLETWLLDWLHARGSVDGVEPSADRPFLEYGVDSLAAVELSQQLEEALDVRLAPIVAWNYPTPRKLARFLAEEAGRGERSFDSANGESVRPLDDSEAAFEQLLSEMESLSDEEVEAALEREDDKEREL